MRAAAKKVLVVNAKDLSRSIQNAAKHLRWSFLRKQVCRPDCNNTRNKVIYKNKLQKITNYPKILMQNDAAEKIKQCTKEKEIYKDLLLHIVNIDLIVAELRS